MTPDWVIYPEDYEALLAEYAMLRLTEKMDTALSLERLATVTGRMRLAGLNVDRIPKEKLVVDNVFTQSWSPALSALNASLWKRLNRHDNQCRQILQYLTANHPLTREHMASIRASMRLVIRLITINEGLETHVQDRHWAPEGVLYTITRKMGVDSRPPRDIVPWLQLVRPGYRTRLELKWVNWDRLD